MITQKTIDQLVKGVIEELNSQGYSKGSKTSADRF